MHNIAFKNDSIRGLFDEKLLGDDIDPNARTIFPEEPDEGRVVISEGHGQNFP